MLKEIIGFPAYKIDTNTGVVKRLPKYKVIAKDARQVALRTEEDTFYFSRGVLLFAARNGIDPRKCVQRGIVVDDEGKPQEWGEYIRQRINNVKAQGVVVGQSGYYNESRFWQLCASLAQGRDVTDKLIRLLLGVRQAAFQQLRAIGAVRSINPTVLYYDAIADIIHRAKEGRELRGSMMMIIRDTLRRLINEERTSSLPLIER